MQGILGTSINNSIFSVKEDEQRNEIVIFMGFSRAMTIPNNKNSILFKAAVAILAKTGICYSHIEENLGISFKTIQKIHRTFDESNDDAELLEKLKSPGRETYKVTEEISEDIYLTATQLKSDGEHDFIKKTIQFIKEKYKITLSRETIRTELKKHKSTNSQKEGKESFDVDVSEKEIGKELITTEGTNATGIKDGNQLFRNQYAGLLLLSGYQSMVFDDFPDAEQLNEQNYFLKVLLIWWMNAILLGAQNFEQQRYFNIEEFEYISGHKKLPCVETMRKHLLDLSTCDDTKATTILLKKNIDYFVEDSTDYYLDPHFEPYTGKANILKGWSTLKNRACKGSFDNFVHDGAGNPLFSMLLDNFYDFREIIIMILNKIKQLRPKKPITLVFDRGGFSTDLMKTIAQKEEQYFVTWQKGFEQEEAKVIDIDNKMTMAYPYNDLGKFKGYDIKFGEDTWECKGFECRRIIIEKKTDKRENFYQSILTNDTNRPGEEIIRTILKRSNQENDFKKQKNNFGLDEITSYRKLKYDELNDKSKTKKTNNPKYQKILSEIAELNKEKNNLLRDLGIKVLDETLSKDFLLKNNKVVKKIKKIDKKIQKKNELKKKIQIKGERKISKLSKCLTEEKEELDLRPKSILGVVKLTARNIIEKGAKEFLEIYENLRDYQKVFRSLIRTSGEIEIIEETLYVKLDSFGRKKFKERCNKYFEHFNQKKIRTLDKKFIIQYRLWRLH